MVVIFSKSKSKFPSVKNKFKFIYLRAPLVIAEKLALTNRNLRHKMEECEALNLNIDALKFEVVASGKYKTQKV